MNKATALIAALTVSAAALAGCGSEGMSKDEAAREHLDAHKDLMASVSVPEAPEPEVTPEPSPEPEPEASPSFESDWTQKQLEAYMTYGGANSLAAFGVDSPEHNITAVTSPEAGVVRFEVADLDYAAGGYALDGFAMNFMSWTGCAAEDVDAVIVETVSGAESVTRDHC